MRKNVMIGDTNVGDDSPVRLIAERHIVEDMGWIPSFYDWAILIKPTKWTMKGYRNVGQDN